MTCWRRSCGSLRRALAGAALIVAAGFADDWLKWVLWIAALAVGFFGPLLAWRPGLASGAGALRRAAWADRDHRDRRVPHRDRSRRSEHQSRRQRHRRCGARPRHRDRASGWRTSLLPGPAPTVAHRAAAVRRELPSRATSTATCTSRWSPESCCSRSRLEVTIAHVSSVLDTTPCVRALRAVQRCTSSRTSRLRVRVVPNPRAAAAPSPAVACLALFPIALGGPGPFGAHARRRGLGRCCSRTRSSGGRRIARTRTPPSGLSLGTTSRRGSSATRLPR